METLLTVLHVVVCLFLIGIVLLQHGKGADIGATFGGSSQSLFGTEGPLPLLNKITTAAAIIFMLTSVVLAYISSHTGTDSVMSELAKPQPVQVDKTATKQTTTEQVAPVKEAAEQAAPEKEATGQAVPAKEATFPESSAPGEKAVEEPAKDPKK
jgi:preprotein translocase subunit SecG